MKIGKYVAAAVLVVASTPAWAGKEMLAVTPSGRTEMMFRDTNATQASGKLAAACMSRGLTVITSQANEVTCELKMNMLKQAFAQALIGNSYSTPPRTFVKFTLAQVGKHAFVQASEWMETQMAFGQMRRGDLVSDDVHNDIMNFMGNAGATFVPGTTFPNHAFLGMASGGAQDVTFKGKKTTGINISEVMPESALAKADVRAGDTLVAVDDKTFKTLADFEKRLRGIAVGTNFNVTVFRAGQPVTVSAVADRRPSIPLEDFSAVAAEQVAVVTPAAAPAPISVADELTKLVALRDKGILSDAEFQAQKTSLLSRSH